MKRILRNEFSILPGPFENFKGINFGIILLTAYILFDFGAFQGVYELVNILRLPYIVAALSIIYALYLTIMKRVSFESPTTRWFVFFVFFLIIYSQISTIDPVEKKYILTLFLQYLANYIIFITCVRKPFQFIFLIDVWLFGIMHSSYHAIYQGGKLYDSIWLRDENHIALITAYAIPFVFILLKQYRSKLKKIFYIVCLAFFVAATVVAASRGAALSMIVVTILCWFLYTQKVRNLLIVALSVILVFSFAPQKFFTEMESLEQGTKESTAADRIYSWGLAYEMFIDHPVLGVGPMNFPQYTTSGYDTEYRYGGMPRVAHSTPLQWLAEMGVIGIVILYMLERTMFKSWRRVNSYKNNKYDSEDDNNKLLEYININHACSITRIGYWVTAIFLTLLPYPFYWILIPFVETWKNISMDYLQNENQGEENNNQSGVGGRQ